MKRAFTGPKQRAFRNNYLAAIIAVAALFLDYSALGQSGPTRSQLQQINALGYNNQTGAFRRLLYTPLDTANTTDSGAIAYLSGKFYLRNSTHWVPWGKALQLTDSTFKVGEDTIKIRGIGGGSGITQLTGPITAGPGSGSVATSITANAVTNTKLAQMPALSVKGNPSNATDDPLDIIAGNDGNVLRRFGTSLGFGAINLASSNAVAGILPVGNTDTLSAGGLSTKSFVDSLKGVYKINSTNTGLVTPSALTFKSVAANRLVNLLPNQFILLDLDPSKTIGNNAPYVQEFSLGGTYSNTITGQKFVSSVTGTGAYAGVLFYSAPKFSWWTAKFGIDNATGNGTLQGGLVKNNDNTFGFSYDRTANQIRYYVSVAAAQTMSSPVSLTNNTPFEVSVSCTGTALKLYITYSDGSVQDITAWDVLDNAGVDMRKKSFYDGSYKFGFWNYSVSSTTTYSFNYIRGGYFGADGIADFTLVNDDTGQPYIRDNKYFFASSFRGYNITGDMLGFARNNGFGVISIDLSTHKMDYESVLMSTYNADTFMMCGANCYVYDTKTQKFLCLLPSFGGLTSGTSFNAGMLRWQWADDDILSGAHIFDSLQQFLPDSIGWDPSAVKINGEWYIGYASRRNPTTDRSWLTIVKTTNFSSFTTVAQEAVPATAGFWEGIKVAKIGGQLYFISSSYTSVKLFNATTGAYSQSIPQTIVITDYPANHGCIFPVMQNGRTKYWWLSFTRDNFNSNEYTYGNAVLFISDQSESGYEWPIRNYLR